MPRLRKKSQASLEFLSSYGWAILISLLILGVLVYSGIIDLKEFLPERCSISPNIKCIAGRIGKTDSGAGALRLRLRNDMAEPIIIDAWSTSSDSDVPFSCGIEPWTGIWPSGEVRDVEFTNCNINEAGFLEGEKAKVSVKISYYLASSSSTFSTDVQGRVFSRVTRLESLLTKPQCSDGIDNDNNGCHDYDGGDTGCSSSSDSIESGGICPQNGGDGMPLYCYVSTLCPDTSLFRLSSLKDAHAESSAMSNYDYKACCRSSDSLTGSCSSPQEIPLRLSATTDAHVEKNTQNNFNVNVCLSAASKLISCYYTDQNCLQSEACLATISADTDAHAADCVTEPFTSRICCSIN